MNEPVHGKEFQGKVALVTGASSGIGRATALALARAGAALCLWGHEMESLETVAVVVGELGCSSLPIAVDLADPVALESAATQALRHFGHVDILINCAGVPGERHSLIDCGLADWDRVHAVNVRAPFLLMRQIGRHMIERGQGGRIVNVTSSSAHRASMSRAAYGSSKAALAQLTRSAAAEFGPHDINVNAVAPGVTDTPFAARGFDQASMRQAVRQGPLANLLGRVSMPEDVAATIVFLCLPASRQITAQTIHVSAGAIV